MGLVQKKQTTTTLKTTHWVFHPHAGYGHLTLTTTAGKLFFVPYALIGVPAGAASMACVSQHLRTLLVALHRAKPWYPRDKRKDQIIKVSRG